MGEASISVEAASTLGSFLGRAMCVPFVNPTHANPFVQDWKFTGRLSKVCRLPPALPQCRSTSEA